ncbi:MAG TPA: choice-of-anchor V domain-containing protein [Thermoanaerobaculia bacterium]|nr:choice-of-anchor V domain-containing protein [Thermoanaerobaculia bacterium]
MRVGPGALALLLPALLGVGAPVAARYADRPPPAHTGGFGEPTCALCHRGAPVDAPGGSLTLVVPPSYAAGEVVEIELRLARPGMERAGFELAARFADGELAGRPAGTLAAASPAVRILPAHRPAGVAYAVHGEEGAEPADGEARWRLRWRAPDPAAGPVVFHAAANAGNLDDSEYGDFVYLAQAVTRPR